MQKDYTVKQSVAGINSIGTLSQGGNENVITLTAAHTFLNGESIRVISGNGHLPDGLDANKVYFAITDSNTSASGLSTNVNIKVAKTLNDALEGNAISVNSKGGVLSVVSRVSDNNSGDIGHPVQWDGTNNQWYVKVAAATTENSIYNIISGNVGL